MTVTPQHLDSKLRDVIYLINAVPHGEHVVLFAQSWFAAHLQPQPVAFARPRLRKQSLGPSNQPPRCPEPAQLRCEAGVS